MAELVAAAGRLRRQLLDGRIFPDHDLSAEPAEEPVADEQPPRRSSPPDALLQGVNVRWGGHSPLLAAPPLIAGKDGARIIAEKGSEKP